MAGRYAAAALRAALALPNGARLERREWPARVGGGVREQLVHRHTVAARHPALGRSGSVLVEIACGCTRTRDPRGDVEGMSLLARRDPTPREVARWLGPWFRRGAVAFGEDAARSARSLFRERKVFRIGARGRLERVYAD